MTTDAHRNHLVDRISNIWERSRHNAFAHKIAAEQAKTWATSMYALEMFFSFISVCLVIITYLTLSSSVDFSFISNLTPKMSKEIFSFLTTIGSVFFSLAGIFLGVLAGYLKFDTQHAEHRASLGSYQHIAQKARMAKWKNMPFEQLEREFLWMEESFQLLKARGREPSNRQFKCAKNIFDEIRKDPSSSRAQSFSVENGDHKHENFSTLVKFNCVRPINRN